MDAYKSFNYISSDDQSEIIHWIRVSINKFKIRLGRIWRFNDESQKIDIFM